MTLFKYICLALVLLNLSAFGLLAFGDIIGGALSYATIILLFGYYFLESKSSPNWWIIVIAILYYVISGFQYTGPTLVFVYDLVKFLLFVLGGWEVAKRINVTEFFFFLLIGAISIGIEAVFFPSNFGRYAGLYLNANVAGFICIYGYSTTYGLKSGSLKLIGQFIFTLMGFLTFSRTFILIWLLINLISLKISIKNIRILGIGFLIFSTLLLLDQVVGLNNPRFDQLKNIVNSKNVSNQEIAEDSRTETWALFYDQILDSPVIGNGFGTFTGKGNEAIGVHNTYLAIIGEAGMLPFLLFLIYLSLMFYKALLYFNRSPYLLMQTISLIVFLLANHNFFNFYYMTFTAMWIQYQLYNLEHSIDNP